jgi:hypothetical protein
LQAAYHPLPHPKKERSYMRAEITWRSAMNGDAPDTDRIAVGSAAPF